MKKESKPQIVTNIRQNPGLINPEDVRKNLKKVDWPDKLKIVFFGTPDVVVPIVKVLHQSFNLVGIVTTLNSKVEEEALKLKIKCFTPEKLNYELEHSLQGLSPDLFIVASYGKIIPEGLLKIPRLGSFVIHPSKLPLYRGASPLPAQILDGVKDSAISIILMDEKMDHGPIIHQENFEIQDNDTFLSLYQFAFQKSAEIIVEVISDYVEGKIKPAVQDDEKATFCGLIKKEDGYFEIDNPPTPEKLDRMIRAYFPWPTTWTLWKGKIVKFLPYKMIQMEGKKVTDLKSFINGYPDFPIKDF